MWCGLSARSAVSWNFPQLFVEYRERVFDRSALLEFTRAAKNLICGFLAVAAFGDGEKRRVKTVPENRENRAAVLIVYRIVLPFACHDAATVDIKQAAQFLAIEIHAIFGAAVIRQTNWITQRIAPSLPVSVHLVAGPVGIKHAGMIILPNPLCTGAVGVGLIVTSNGTERSIAINRFFINPRRVKCFAAQGATVLHGDQGAAFLAGCPFGNVVRWQFVGLNKVRNRSGKHEERTRATGGKNHQRRPEQETFTRPAKGLWLSLILHVCVRS